MTEYSVKNKVILSFWKDNVSGTLQEQKDAIVLHLLREFGLQPTNEIKISLRKSLCSRFFNNYKLQFDKLPKNQRSVESFENKYQKWLERDFRFQYIPAERINTRKKGRPVVSYEQASQKTKRRKIKALASDMSVDELCDIAKKKMKVDGNEDGAILISTAFDHGSATNVMSTLKNSQNSQMKKMTPEEALEMLIACNLTKSSYNNIRCRARIHGHDLYPSYKQIAKAKKRAYPQNLQISESKCEVSLQDLMEQTVKSLFDFLKLPPCEDNNKRQLVLFVKYGFDGTNTNRYKQKSDEKNCVLDHMFCSCIVPLQLVDKNTDQLYWSNSTPSSTRFCRPIKILYEKETNELCQMEEADLKGQIDHLNDIEIDGYTIGFNMMLTMIDGKVCNALNNTSSQKCFACDSTISQLNNIDDMIRKPIKESALQYGFSVLHAYIRFMELVLHVSYRMEIKLWRVPKEKDYIIKARKKEIQGGLYEELGILVDAPTQGSGNTNDGNTARRFFNNVDVVARITGFDKELLHKLKVILAVISSGYSINSAAFQDYTENAARRYVNLYDYYYMPPSMHIILIHGHKIIKELMLPIGMLSEEAQESNHKNIKRFRDRFSRKISRVETNGDTFKRLLLNSDPFLSLLNKAPSKKSIALPYDMKRLLIIENVTEDSGDSDSGNDNEDSLSDKE